jgi:citrate synthase
MQSPKHDQVRSRNEPFVQKTATRIWQEQPSDDNPFIATSAMCHGYDLFELMHKRSFVDVFFLLFRGELPGKNESQILQALMIALINPGPRHPATRAAMNVGVGKTDPLHIVPIATAVLGGDYQGGGEIESAMRFLRKQLHTDAHEFSHALSENEVNQTCSENVMPGFGQRYGGIDLFAANVAKELCELPGAGPALVWGCKFADELAASGRGWFMTGVAAAIFADLGFHPRVGGCLFQLMGAPGMLAQGLELANKPITAMPFVSDENYVIER